MLAENRMTLLKLRICDCLVPPLLQSECYGMFEPYFCCLSTDSVKSGREISFTLYLSRDTNQLALLLGMGIEALTENRLNLVKRLQLSNNAWMLWHAELGEKC